MRFGAVTLHEQDGHTAGRALLRRLYQEETGEDLPQVHITRRGQPYFLDSPYHFSISHTRRHVFCALSREPVGIDAEELDRVVYRGLAEKILSPSEQAQYDAAADKQRAILTFWVLKEAAVKLTGEGLRGYPNQTAFQLDDPRVQEIDGCLVAILTK